MIFPACECFSPPRWKISWKIPISTKAGFSFFSTKNLTGDISSSMQLETKNSFCQKRRKKRDQGRGERRGSNRQVEILHWASCQRVMFHVCLKAFQAGLLSIYAACSVPHRTNCHASTPLVTSAHKGPAASRSCEAHLFGNPSCSVRFPGCGLHLLGGRDQWERHRTERRKLWCSIPPFSEGLWELIATCEGPSRAREQAQIKYHWLVINLSGDDAFPASSFPLNTTYLKDTTTRIDISGFLHCQTSLSRLFRPAYLEAHPVNCTSFWELSKYQAESRFKLTHYPCCLYRWSLSSTGLAWTLCQGGSKNSVVTLPKISEKPQHSQDEWVTGGGTHPATS